MRMLEDYLPRWDARSVHATVVRASRPAVYDAARRLDLSRATPARLLLRLRGMPASALTLDGLRQLGFVLLEEQRPEGFALGIVGRFWTARGGLCAVTPEGFRTFAEPGYARAVWGFATEERGRDTLLRTETRIQATNPAARRRFLAYWALVGPFSGLLRRVALRAIRQDAEGRA